MVYACHIVMQDIVAIEHIFENKNIRNGQEFDKKSPKMCLWRITAVRVWLANYGNAWLLVIYEAVTCEVNSGRLYLWVKTANIEHFWDKPSARR